MIEFIIPLNLPVRAVEITAKTESPSERLLQEIARWASHHQQGRSNEQGLPDRQNSTDARLTRAEIEQELESLREQRTFFNKAADELRNATKAADKRLNGMLREFQEATVELAQAIASKLIFEEIDNDRFPIANLVHEVIGRLDATSAAVIRLHPADLALIQDQPAIHESHHEKSLRFVADSTLARGDCKAKAGEISVIYEFRRQIDEIRRQLLSTVSGHAEA